MTLTSLALSIVLAAPSTALAPQIIPASTTITGATQVTVKPLSSGSTIRCTTDGNSPIATNGKNPSATATRYTAPFTVSTTTTVKCAAWVQNKKVSPVASSTYTRTSLADCATASLRGTGTIYYYCSCDTGAGAGCTAGDNANAGTSPSAPRKTFGNARTRFNGMNAGDTIALCRTGAWDVVQGTDGQDFGNANCTAESTCDFRDYIPSWGSSSSARPRINTTQSYTMAFRSSGHDEGYRLWNLDIRQAAATDGIFFYDDVSDVDMCNLYMDGTSYASGNGLPIYIHPSAGGPNFTIRYSEFRNYGNQGILGGADNFLIDSNVFRDNGVGANTRHSVYIAGGAGFTTVSVVNNEFHAPSGCVGPIVVLHEIINDLVVENNYIESPSTNANCFAIQSSWSSYADPAHFMNAKFRRNRMFMGGSSRMEIKGCDGACEITDNILSGAYLAVGTDSCTETSGESGVWCTHTAKVQNNSIYNGYLTIGSSAYDTIAENNAVTGTCTYNGTYIRQDDDVCSVTASDAWVDAAGGNFTPKQSGSAPLIGAANQTYYSPIAVGTVNWSPVDTGSSRSPPIDAGAMKR